MKQIDLGEDQTYMKALIYGKPGTGKTSFACTAPKPLILLSERQGAFHIKAAVKRLNIAPDRRPLVMFMEKIEDYRSVGRTLMLGTQDPSLRNGPFVVKDEQGTVLFEHPTWPETVVFDSFTDACKLIEDDINRIAPPKPGKDGLPVPSERYWGALKDRVEKLIRHFRDIDFHLIFLCLEDDKTTGEGEAAVRTVGPQLPMRTLPGAIAASVNVVGIMTRVIRMSDANEQAEVKWGVKTVGPGFYLLKPCRPLADLERPNFSYWLAKIAGSVKVDEAEDVTQVVEVES